MCHCFTGKDDSQARGRLGTLNVQPLAEPVVPDVQAAIGCAARLGDNGDQANVWMQILEVANRCEFII